MRALSINYLSLCSIRACVGFGPFFVGVVKAEPTYVWTQTVGGLFGISPNSIRIDLNGDLLIAGDFRGSFDFDPTSGADVRNAGNTNDAFVTKWCPDGSYGHTCTIGGVNGYLSNIIAESDAEGNTYVAGSFWGTVDFDGDDIHPPVTAGAWDIFIMKLSGSCTPLWTKTIGDTGSDLLYDFHVGGDGELVIAGSFRGVVDFDPSEDGVDFREAAGPWDVFAAKYSANGELVWARTFEGDSGERLLDMALDSQDDILLTGQFSVAMDFDPTEGIDTHIPVGGLSEVFITKLTGSGEYRWTGTFGSIDPSYNDWSFAVVADEARNVFVAGIFDCVADLDPTKNTELHSAQGDTDAFIVKLSPEGAFEWARTIGGEYDETISELAVDREGDVICVGSFSGQVDFDPTAGMDLREGNGDGFVTILRNDGTYVWTGTIGGCGGDLYNAVAARPLGDTILAGSFCWLVDFGDPCAGQHPCAADLDPTGATDIHVSNIDSGLIGSGDMAITTLTTFVATGDPDEDGDFDLRDFGALATCYDEFALTARCRSLDLEPTIRVDAADYALWAAEFSGP